jgi:hypothetical protein
MKPAPIKPNFKLFLFIDATSFAANSELKAETVSGLHLCSLVAPLCR